MEIIETAPKPTLKERLQNRIDMNDPKVRRTYYVGRIAGKVVKYALVAGAAVLVYKAATGDTTIEDVIPDVLDES